MTSSAHGPDRPVPPLGAQPHRGAGRADAVVRCVSPGSGAAAMLTAAPLPDRPGARLSGDCDLDSRQVLASALGIVTRIPGPVVHLDLSAVMFPGRGRGGRPGARVGYLYRSGQAPVDPRPALPLRKVVEMFPDECAALEVAA
ncbi:hypothetical protein GCM10020254_09720 [Streptomyces goshikiensis]